MSADDDRKLFEEYAERMRDLIGDLSRPTHHEVHLTDAVGVTDADVSFTRERTSLIVATTVAVGTPTVIAEINPDLVLRVIERLSSIETLSTLGSMAPAIKAIAEDIHDRYDLHQIMTILEAVLLVLAHMSSIS